MLALHGVTDVDSGHQYPVLPYQPSIAVHHSDTAIIVKSRKVCYLHNAPADSLARQQFQAWGWMLTQKQDDIRFCICMSVSEKVSHWDAYISDTSVISHVFRRTNEKDKCGGGIC